MKSVRRRGKTKVGKKRTYGVAEIPPAYYSQKYPPPNGKIFSTIVSSSN